MKKPEALLSLLLALILLLSSAAFSSNAQSSDEKAIRALIQRFSAAVKAKDVNRVMSVYVSNETLFVFDFIPPRQFVGAKAYRKDFEEFFSLFPGPVDYKISDLSVTAAGTLGFSHRIDNLTLTDKKGTKAKFVLRVTDVYRKINGKWLIVHEHVSVPVDPDTGKADFSSKP